MGNEIIAQVLGEGQVKLTLFQACLMHSPICFLEDSLTIQYSKFYQASSNIKKQDQPKSY